MNIKSAYEYSEELKHLESIIKDMKKTMARVEDAAKTEVENPFSPEGIMLDALSYAQMDMVKALEYLEARYNHIKAMLSDSFF